MLSPAEDLHYHTQVILGYLIKQIFLLLAVQQFTHIITCKIIGLNHGKRVSFVSLLMRVCLQEMHRGSYRDSITKKRILADGAEQRIRIHIFKRWHAEQFLSLSLSLVMFKMFNRSPKEQ